MQYADYALWQRDWLQGERLQGQLDYWRQQLGGLTALQLPTDRPRPAVQSFRGAKRASGVQGAGVDSAAAIVEPAGGCDAVHDALLAGWQALLARYSGQEDVLVGVPAANRTHRSIEGLIGFFVNTLVLRGDLSGDPPFRDLLGRVREACLGAYAHQDVPFERVVEAVQPPRDLSRTPLFQVMFAWQNAPMPALEMGEMRLRPLPLEGETVQFELTLDLQEVGEQIEGTLGYNTDLFDRATAERLVEHLGVLLEAVAADAGCRVGRLPLLGEPERRQVLDDWNATEASYPREVCLHELFQHQAASHHEAVALECAGATTHLRRS